MVFPAISTVKTTAAERLQRATNARKIVLLYAGVPAVISLVLTLISYLLSLQIADTGGLGGLGTRSLLETLQRMLQIVSIVFSVFWAYGYTRVLLHWSRGERAWNGDLLEGFRRWGVVLRGALLQMLLYFGAFILAMQLSSVLFALTPLADNMAALLEQMLADPSFMPSEEAMLDALVGYLPFLAVSMMVLILPLVYRLRMMNFVLMDQPEMGAVYAMRVSTLMMRKNRLKLFKLDLSFWWFYLLELLVSALYYSDVALQLAGVDLGLSSDALFFAACVLGLAAQTALYVWRRNNVMLSYTAVYDDLKIQSQEFLEKQTEYPGRAI